MKGTFAVAVALLFTLDAQTLAADGNAGRGQRVLALARPVIPYSRPEYDRPKFIGGVGPKSGKRGELQPIFVRP